jgi:membrane protein DedA with SNARE-associated domain
MVLATAVLVVGDYVGVLEDPLNLKENFAQRPYLSGALLLGIEEAGIPLPAPGDLIIMYSAHSVHRKAPALVGVWIALTGAVALGSTLLFFVARRAGHRLVRGRIGHALHLDPDRVRRIHGWLERWGFWTVVGGRLLPGGRVAITVVAASFDVPYPIFVAGVVTSCAVWITLFMVVGVLLGPKADEFARAHRTASVGIPLAFGLAFLAYLGFRLVKISRSPAGKPQ